MINRQISGVGTKCERVVVKFHSPHSEGGVSHQCRVGRQPQRRCFIRRNFIECQALCHLKRSARELEQIRTGQRRATVGLQESGDGEVRFCQCKGGVVRAQDSGNHASFLEGQGAARRVKSALHIDRSNKRQVCAARVQDGTIVEGKGVLDGQVCTG